MSDVSQGVYRELTPAAIILGFFQGVILNLAFVYAALKLGFSIGGSTVAAIMGYALLRGVLKKGTCIENNINQTIASGINTAGTGIVFTVPALFMLNAKWTSEGLPGIDFSFGPLLMGGIGGAILGVVLIVPLRKQMVELDRLRFPSGVAVTTIIRSGATGLSKAKLLALGFLISAAWKLLMVSGWLEIPGLIEHEEFNFGFGVIPAYLAPAVYLSLMNLAAGLLAGRGGLPFFIGGVIAWWFISPASVAFNWTPEGAGDAATAGFIYGKMLRPLGIGCLIGAALMGMVTCFPAIVSAFKSLASASKVAGVAKDTEREELSIVAIVIGVISAMALMMGASLLTPGVTVPQAFVSALVGVLWAGVAGLIVAQATGMTDISPMSGMALISVTLMMFLLDGNVAAAMVVGVGVSVAVGQGADMMQDLKTGFMLGGRPFRQQIVQYGVTWIGALIALGAIYILWQNGPDGAGGFGEGSPLPAPQAGALMGIIDAVQSGNVPMDKYLMGGVAGALLGAAPMAGVGVLIGLAMYLPFSITLGYGIGCMTQMAIKKVKGDAFCEHKLVPFAAGLIVGEALTGIGHSAWQIFVR